jgi:hypothetical protein
LTAAYPILINPLFRDGSLDLSAKDRLRVWDTAYHRGMASMPLLALATAVAFTTSAYAFGPSTAGELVGYNTRKTSLVVASALHLAIMPFTVRRKPAQHALTPPLPTHLTLTLTPSFISPQIFAIKPLNNVLLGMRKLASANEETYTAADIEPKFAKWATLHNVRAALSAAGFAVALVCELSVWRI